MRTTTLKTLRYASVAAALMVLPACAVDTDVDGPLEQDATESDVSVGEDAEQTDIAQDAALDVTPDVATDVETDTTVDTSVDTQSDAELDGSGDASGDTTTDVEADGSEDASSDTSPTFCTGIAVADGVEAPTDNDWVAPECVTCEGAMAPTWELRDFQLQSCGYDQIYGLDRFQGEVVVSFLWLATCSFCQGQLLQVERMKLELEAEGITPHFVGLISTASQDREDWQTLLLDRGSMPFFQSTTDVNAWTLHDGDKDDVYIYGTDGSLDTFLDDDVEGVLFNLSTDEGYAFVRAAIVAAWERAHGPTE